MAQEDEKSLAKRPELNIDKLSKGGLIVGAEKAIRGSLMAVSGMALERITRERAGVSPELRLPERVVYFLDPLTRRMVMISNREDTGRGVERAGLFAEIVELDEEGKPHYSLSTSEVIIPSDQYQFIAVGPNKYGLPPSHIELVEEDELVKGDETKAKKEKFVSWNEGLSNLQLWMNEIRATPEEDLGVFLERFHALKKTKTMEVQDIIRRSFPQGWQGFSENSAPINIIISDNQNRELLLRASFAAGLYPVFWDIKRVIESQMALQQRNPKLLQTLEERWYLKGDCEIGGRDLPAVMTFDSLAFFRFDQDFIAKISSLPSSVHIHDSLATLIPAFQKNNPLFSVVEIWRGPEDERSFRRLEPWKETHGAYGVPLVEEQYRKLLTKLKADLLLTMFLRGGAPIVK